MPYKDKNKEKAYKKRYYQKNRDKLLERHKKYNKDHIDELKIYSEKWREDNKKRKKIIDAERYQKNKEEIKKKTRIFGKSNFCLDCGKLIWKESTRCGSCASKGENNTHYGKTEELSSRWKGNKVGYNGVHTWVRKHKPKPKFCEICKLKPPVDLANISGKYKRDVNDFEWLCKKCHFIKDGLIKNLRHLEKRGHRKNLIQCTRCKKFKPKEDFYEDISKWDKLSSWCKKCKKEHQNKYHKKNKEILNKKCKICNRLLDFRNKFGLCKKHKKLKI